ncbi:MAG: DUF4230 domain-containing protein [Phycisphaeraceae bacterium]|nr:DUF4230 domain-containing protein [Phycisphaerales bacterium]MCB9841879.1 DUF4230 domain-containing protein [Phycisphaeraceae bacterium]
MSEALLVITGVVLGGIIAFLLVRKLGKGAPVRTTTLDAVVDQVRAVGKLVGLEVHAKEIATSTKGWSWVPQLLLSQAKVAMIFFFEKQYFIDLSKLTKRDVRDMGDGKYVVILPKLEGHLRLVDLKPYDVQAGRILGLLDVIQMTAETQDKLMRDAQRDASSLFERHEDRYIAEAHRSVERQLKALMRLVDADVSFEWRTLTGEVRHTTPASPAATV